MMTTSESGLNVQLLQDLRQKYPEVAEHVITSCVRQNKNDRKKCIEALDKETPNALFGNDQFIPRLQDMHINDQRSRSDSASSGISSASTSSSSSYKLHTDYRQQPMEPSYTSDFNQYVKDSSSIPNIECRISASTSPQTKSNNILSSGLRQIPVQHIQTVHSPQDKPSGNSQNPIVYNILYPRDNRLPQGMHPNYLNQPNINYSLGRSPITSQSNHGPPVTQRSYSVQPVLDQHVNMNITRLLPGDRTPVYSPGNYSQGLQSSQSEPFLIGLANNGGTHSNSFFTPLVVNVGTQPAFPHHDLVTCHSAGDLSRQDLNIAGAINPPPFKYLPDPSSGGTSQGDNGHFYTHYNNDCRVSGHPPVTSRSSSSDSEHSVIGNPDGERRHVSTINFTPKVVPSPSSSHSSLSSDSSHPPEVMPRRQSGPAQEEAAYTQALISFQNERMSKLKFDLESELRKLQKLRLQVSQMEKNMYENRRSRSVNCSPSIDDVAKLRELNRRLQADIQVSTREIDMYNNGQIPLGVYDPAALEQQNFFKNMNPGQRGSIFAPPHQERPTSDSPPPPLPPRIHAIPPPPPAQPPMGSGDSDGDGEQWSCSACTLLNHPALNKCECCEMPRINSSPPSTGLSSHGT